MEPRKDKGSHFAVSDKESGPATATMDTEQKQKSKPSELEEAKKLFGYHQSDSQESTALSSRMSAQFAQLNAVNAQHAQQNDQIAQIDKKLEEESKNPFNDDPELNAKIDLIKQKHKQAIEQKNEEIKASIARMQTLITSTNTTDIDTIIVQAHRDYTSADDMENLERSKAFLLEYMLKNHDKPKKINAIIQATGLNIPEYKTTTLKTAAQLLHTKIFTELGKKPVKEQLAIIQKISSRMEPDKHNDFKQESTSFSQKTPLKKGATVIESAKEKIEKQNETVQQELATLNTLVQEQQALIVQYDNFVNVQLPDLHYIDSLIKTRQKEHEHVVSGLEENLQEIQEIKSSIDPQYYSIIDGEIASVNEELIACEQFYEQLLKTLEYPAISRTEADAAVEKMKTLDKEMQFLVQKQIAIAHCVKERIEFSNLEPEAKETNKQILSKREQAMRLQQGIDLLSGSPRSSDEFDRRIPATPITIINRTIAQLKEMKMDSKTTPNELRQQNKPEIEKRQKARQAAWSAEYTNVNQLTDRKKGLTDATLIAIHETLYATLKNEAKYWHERNSTNYWNDRQTRLFSGVKVKYTDESGKVHTVKVPTGLGNMMIALHPEECKPEPRKFFSSRKKDATELKPLTAVEAATRLQACQEFAKERFDKKKGGKPLTERNANIGDPGQARNNAILILVSDAAFENAATNTGALKKLDTDFKQCKEELREHPDKKPVALFRRPGRKAG